jgi:hypothetical protein
MSNNLRRYSSVGTGKDLSVTAFVGVKGNTSIQFTIGDKYCCLSRKQLFDLKKVIDNRLKRKPGYCATDTFLGKVER